MKAFIINTEDVPHDHGRL